MLIGLGLALLVGIGLAVILTRIITGPITRITGVAESISRGDLSQRIEITSNDEVGQLAEAFRRMCASLKAVSRELVGLTKAALEGILDRRADTSRHQGQYAEISAGSTTCWARCSNRSTRPRPVLQSAAGKDLTQRVEGGYKGQFAELKENINQTVQALDEALSQVSEAVEQVTSASTQIASGSQNLAQGASEQASSLEEISSSLEEMSSMTKQNADNATQAKLLSSGGPASRPTGQQRDAQDGRGDHPDQVLLGQDRADRQDHR